MKKVYFNSYYNRAIMLDDERKTYVLLKADTARKIRFKDYRDGFTKAQRIEYIAELFKNAKKAGYKRQ